MLPAEQATPDVHDCGDGIDEVNGNIAEGHGEKKDRCDTDAYARRKEALICR